MMKIKQLLLAGLVIFSASTAHAETKLTTKKQKPSAHALISAAKKLGIMISAGTLSFYLSDVAIDAFKKLNPSSHGALDGFPSKVAFPILGALGVWLICKLYNGDCETDVANTPGNTIPGLPKKNKESKTDTGSAMPLCMGNCC